MKRSFRQRVRGWFGLQRGPLIRVYDGYGDQDNIIVYGHVLRSGPLAVKRYRGHVVANTLALLRLFMVKPMAKATVGLEWNRTQYQATTDEQGFFKFEWTPGATIQQGWEPVTVTLLGRSPKKRTVKEVGRVFIPPLGQISIISDIDDTFLISHSANLRKRLYVLFTENAETREPFEDVVAHYQALSIGTGDGSRPNPFFYVSSSEWNLYDYIKTFCARHGLPEGILLLSPIKQLVSLLKTGQGKHSIKFVRIARILSSYPRHRYILLGDDTQQDPEIYASIVAHFPGMVKAVYIRKVHAPNREKVNGFIKKMSGASVECCYFAHSREAIEHSRKLGLIH